MKSLDGRGAGVVADAMLLALALSRRDDAAEHLLKILDSEAEVRAIAALAALAVLRHRPGIEERVRAIVERRRSTKLRKRLQPKIRLIRQGASSGPA